MIELHVIERSWEPGPLVRLMESNPITRIFWNIIKCCFGYNDEYRCRDWDAMNASVQHYYTTIRPGDPQYPRYYAAMQNFFYYNPHLRSRYPMAPPITHTHIPAPQPIRMHPTSVPISQGVPPMDRSPQSLPSRVVPLSQQNSGVPPMDRSPQSLSSRVVPLSQQNSGVPPMDRTSQVSVPVVRQNRAPRAVPLSQQNFNTLPNISPTAQLHSRPDPNAAVPLSQQNARVPPMDDPRRR